LAAVKKSTHPRRYELYEIFCAILYVLREGCRWRAIPHDFPKWQNVYYHYRMWKAAGPDGESVLDKVERKLVEAAREEAGREAQASMLIVDSRSVKNADTAEESGYDGGKKISGIKLHLGVDTLGLPHAKLVTAANVGDREGALLMMEANMANLTRLEKVLCDGGYTGDDFALGVFRLFGPDTRVECVLRSELHSFVVLPKRWIVERSFAWLDNCRRLWKNCERSFHSSLQMVNLAFISLLLRRDPKKPCFNLPSLVPNDSPVFLIAA